MSATDQANESFDPTQLKGEPRGALRLAAGDSIVDAAAAAGVNEKTLRRRLQDPRYRMQVSQLRQKALDAAVGSLVSSTGDAVATLRELMNTAASEHVRLQASKSVLELALSLGEAVETQQRIETLEQAYVRERELRITMWQRERIEG